MRGFDLGGLLRAGTWVLICAALALASACSSSGGDSPGGKTDDGDTDPLELVQYFFAGPDPDADEGDVYRLELWVTDGTADGTTLVKNINDGDESEPYGFAELDGIVYFFADDGVTGIELWKTDGTSAGTEPVADLNAGVYFPFYLTAIDGMLYFSGDNGATGVEPFQSNGTDSGTENVCDVRSGTANSNPDGFALIDGELIFGATTGNPEGSELRKCSASTASLILDIDPTLNTGSDPTEFTMAGGLVYFVAADDTNGRELWITDGTSGGTEMVEDIRTGEDLGSQIQGLVPFNGEVYFFADPDGGGADELWKSDGTATGTEMVSDFGAPESGSGLELVASNGTLYMLVSLPEGLHVFESDGTTDGTVDRTDDIGLTQDSACMSSGLLGWSNDLLLFFLGTDGGDTVQLWGTDFTESGTNPVGDVEIVENCG